MGCCQTTSSISTMDGRKTLAGTSLAGEPSSRMGKIFSEMNQMTTSTPKQSGIDGQAVLIFFLTQLYFSDIREAILSYIAFRDLIRLGSCSK